MLTNKCPNCRRGQVFTHKGIFPLGKVVDLEEHCAVCGQRLKGENNNGAGINYALTIIILFGNLLWYWPVFGMDYRDYSIYYFLTVSTVVVILLQPWLMRLSRMVYLYMLVPYKSGPALPDEYVS